MLHMYKCSKRYLHLLIILSNSYLCVSFVVCVRECICGGCLLSASAQPQNASQLPTVFTLLSVLFYDLWTV